MRGIYPLLAKKPKNGCGEFFSKKAPKQIRQYLKIYNQIILPLHILINDQYIGPSHTLFSKSTLDRYGLKQTELENSIVIEKQESNNSKNNFDIGELLDVCISTDVLKEDKEASPEVIHSLNIFNINEEESAVHIDDCENVDEELDEELNLNASCTDTNNNDEHKSNISSQASDSTIVSELMASLKYRNLFLVPEKLCDKAIRNLIHCSKKQFLDFYKSIKDNSCFKTYRQRDMMTLYSCAFLFRLKVLCNNMIIRIFYHHSYNSFIVV